MTATEDIRAIGLTDFVRDSHLIDYVDENIIVLDNIGSNIPRQGKFRLDCLLMVFCLEGKSTVNINGQAVLLTQAPFHRHQASERQDTACHHQRPCHGVHPVRIEALRHKHQGSSRPL